MTNNSQNIPIIEIFGPTIQGEGNMIGKTTMFIRVGACDYKCYHCDSMHAVDKHQIALRAEYLSPAEIVARIKAEDKSGACPWVTISGGNPALWEMGDVVAALKNAGYKIAVETQGTYYKEWLEFCDLVTVSPKAPSMWTAPDMGLLLGFKKLFDCRRRWPDILPAVCLKIAVFNEADIDFAATIADVFPEEQMWLSLGNTDEPKFLEDGTQQGRTAEELRQILCTRYESLANYIYRHPHPNIRNAVFLPQLHVLIWGNAGKR